MDLPIILVRFGELMLVEQQTGKAVGVAQFELSIHFDRLERANFDADLAAHANGDVDIENLWIELRFADVIRFLVLALDDVDALWRALLLANLAGHTAQSGLRIVVVNQNRKIAIVLRQRSPLLRILHCDQALLVEITSDKVSRSNRHSLEYASANHRFPCVKSLTVESLDRQSVLTL